MEGSVMLTINVKPTLFFSKCDECWTLTHSTTHFTLELRVKHDHSGTPSLRFFIWSDGEPTEILATTKPQDQDLPDNFWFLAEAEKTFGTIRPYIEDLTLRWQALNLIVAAAITEP
jgi:hypothetical protein